MLLVFYRIGMSGEKKILTMYKTCSICNKIHDMNIICKRPYKYKKRRKSDKFRSTYEWKQKREEIKRRDRYLCLACLNSIDDTNFMYNYKNLQVHHIISIEEYYDKRLDNENLITLCPLHHKMAEQREISLETLLKLVPKE